MAVTENDLDTKPQKMPITVRKMIFIFLQKNEGIFKFCISFVHIHHLHLSGLTVRLPVWPWQQVHLTDVRTGGDAGSMNIHYDVTGLLTAVWRSHSGQIVWAAWIG